MEDDMLSEFVYQLGNLPELPKSILIESDKQKFCFLLLKKRYKATSLWLRHIVLAEALSPEALSPEAQLYQAHAEFSAAKLRLTIAVHSRSISDAVHYFKSPAAMWIVGEYYKSEKALASIGLTDFSLVTTSKQKNLSENIDTINAFTNLSVRPAFKFESENLSDLVILEAQEIAKTDCDFLIGHFQPFLRDWKRFVTKLKRCQHFRLVRLLPDDYLLISHKQTNLLI